MKKELEVEYVLQFIGMKKLITNIWKIMIKNHHILVWDVNNLHGYALSQNLPVDNFGWIEEFSQFNKDFIKNHNEEIDEGYFLEVDVQYLKN